MAIVDEYYVWTYGTGEGNDGPRVKVFLLSNSTTLGCVRFYEGKAIPSDSQEANGEITMNLPLSMFGNVIDILRNEGPVAIAFLKNQALLAIGHEPVGEGE